MYCPDCGHNNPEANKFCGMCGERLPQRPAKSSVLAAERRERVAQHDPEPVPPALRHPEPIDQPVSETPRPLDSAPTDAPGVSGPSFLGLNSTSDSSPEFTYLYEDEPSGGSHAPLVVFLVALVAVAGVLYWQWQPLRNWVTTRATQKVDTGGPAPAQPAASTTPASPSNDTQPAAQPATPQQDNATPAQPDNQKQTQPDNPNQAQPNDQTQPDQAAAPQKNKNEDESAGAAAAAPHKAQVEARTVKKETKKEARTTTRAEGDVRTAARQRKEPETPAGADLVAAGEKYLYGQGVAQNCQQAVVDFNAAAKQENPRAMAHLGALYATGECLPLNRVTAYRWFSRALAKDRSNAYLENNLNMLWREMDAREQNQITQQTQAENRM